MTIEISPFWAGVLVAVAVIAVLALVVPTVMLFIYSDNPVSLWRSNRRARKARQTEATRETLDRIREGRLGEPRQVARPVDPDNPPTWRTYSPREGRPTRSCTCHPNRPLEPGQKVLWFPIKDGDGAVEVYCEEGVGANA